MTISSSKHKKTLLRRTLLLSIAFSLFIWPGFLVNWLFPYNINYFANKFTSQWLNMEPPCMPLKEYSQQSEGYWQFYGYPYRESLNEKTLSNILKITHTQETILTDVHKLVMDTISDDNSLFAKYKTYWDGQKSERGIVYVSGPGYYWLTMLSIKYIRAVLMDGIPIQIFVPHKSNDDQHCNKIQMVFTNVECVYFDQHLSASVLESLNGYQYKALALLMSKFSDTLYLDSDNIPLVQPSTMFNSKEYKEHGMVSWPDFWKRSTNYKFYEMAGIKNSGPTITSTPSVEAGQIMINKKTHFKTVLLSLYYNVWGPDYFYPIFNQGFPGEGDKDTFYLASRVTGEGSYLTTGVKTKSFGYKDKQGSYHGQGIIQASPDVEDSKFWFLHLNQPKILINQMITEGFFDRGLKRVWNLIRYAQKDSSNETPFKQSVGDLELKIWKLIYDLLKKDFKGYQVFSELGNDEAADYVAQQIRVIRNQV